MRSTVVWLLACACSQPAKPPPTPQVVSADAGNAELVAPADAPADASVAPPRPSPWSQKDFDWETVRATVVAARRARADHAPHACSPPEGCSPRPTALAARGRLVGGWAPDAKLATFRLDLGSEDGVSAYHWAAVVDTSGQRITRFFRVEKIRERESIARIELDEMVRDARVALVVDPPVAARGHR